MLLNKNSIKVILAFTGVIIVGLISLVYIDSLKGDAENTSASASLTK
jgi:hypothetical protein